MMYSKNFPRCARQFVKNFFFKTMKKQQWYIQNISALRALICYELLRISEEKSWKMNDLVKKYPALRAPIC